MPVLPDFSPENASFGRTAAFGQSMMERAQNQQIAQARSDQQTQEFQAKLPAIQAQAVADVASAHASVQNAALLEQFRAKAANESKDLNDAYLNAIQLPSFDQQATALSALQPRVAYMDALPEYKGFVTAVNNATLRAHGSAQIDRQLNNKLDVQGAKNEAAIEIQKERFAMQTQMATEREKHAQDLADARAQLQQSKLDQAGTTEYNKERGKAQAAMVADVQSRVPQYQDTLSQISRNRALLAQGVNQGKGVETVLGVEQVINSFLPGTFDTSKQEALKQNYADIALAAASKMKGQGSITEAERALLADSVAKFGNSPEGAKYIMDFMEAVAKRQIARADYYNEIESGDQMVTAKHTSDFYKNNPLTKYLNSPISQQADETGGNASPLTPDEQARLKALKAKRGT